MGRSAATPTGVLQNIITCFCFKAKPISTTKLTKLVYLADVYHMEMFGARLTDVPFRHYHYGPWAAEVGQEFEQLCTQGIVEEKTRTTSKGYRAIVPTPRVRQTTVQLPKTGFEAVEAVIEDWGRASTDEVTTFAKTTLPFVGTEFGEEIDFARVDLVVEYAKARGVPLKEAATALVENNPQVMAALRRARGDV